MKISSGCHFREIKTAEGWQDQIFDDDDDFWVSEWWNQRQSHPLQEWNILCDRNMLSINLDRKYFELVFNLNTISHGFYRGSGYILGDLTNYKFN